MPAPSAVRQTQAEMKLDEIDDFFQLYLDCTPEQRWAMILYGAATWGISACATFPRMFFGSEKEESGKTLAMSMTVCLCSRPIDAAGTSFDLVAALANAALEPEKGVPTVFRDEIIEVFPSGGQGRGGNVVGDIMRRGYKWGATRGRARGGESQRYSIFTPFLCTGVGAAALPRDIRTRCIVVTMQQGTPKKYFDVRDAESRAIRLGRALGQEVQRVIPLIEEFRAIDLGIPRLIGRRLEVWEPLFAVAIALGGEKWLKRCTQAFNSLSLAQMDSPELTPRQEMLKLLAEVAPDVTLDEFVPGRALANQLLHMTAFKGQTIAGMAALIADAMPLQTTQRRLSSGDRVRGYWLHQILEAWEMARPLEPDEIDPPEVEDPFAVTGEEDDEEEAAPLGASGTSGTVVSTAPPVTVPPALPLGFERVDSSHQDRQRVATGPPSIRYSPLHRGDT